MPLHKKLSRAEPLRDQSKRNVVRGHALFVRFMERKGLADCVKYFPDCMTLGNLRHCTPRELMKKYNVKEAKDRERIMKIVDESHREDLSDNEASVFKTSNAHFGMNTHIFSLLVYYYLCSLLMLFITSHYMLIVYFA